MSDDTPPRDETLPAPTMEIAFHGVDHSDFVENEIRTRADKLVQMYPRIESIRVVVKCDHHSKTKGNLYGLHIHLGVPGNDLYVDREPQQHQEHEEIEVVVNDGFQAMTRQLRDYLQKRRDKERRG